MAFCMKKSCECIEIKKKKRKSTVKKMVWFFGSNEKKKKNGRQKISSFRNVFVFIFFFCFCEKKNKQTNKAKTTNSIHTDVCSLLVNVCQSLLCAISLNSKCVGNNFSTSVYFAHIEAAIHTLLITYANKFKVCCGAVCLHSLNIPYFT